MLWTLGCAVYLKEFYYDYIDKYVDHADFQYAEMGTDSANFAISTAKLKYVIKPDMNDEYQCCFFSVLIVLIY